MRCVRRRTSKKTESQRSLASALFSRFLRRSEICPLNPGPRPFKLRYGWEGCNELVDAFLNLFWVLLIIGHSEPFEIFTLANCSCPTSPSGPCLSVPRCPTNLYSPKIFG